MTSLRTRNWHLVRPLLMTIVLFSWTLPIRGEIGDPTLETDHPFYPGEGAMQTIEQCVARATAGKESPQEKAIALYLWMLTHQFHLSSPQEWNDPGKVPDCRNPDYEMVVYDANRGRFSYAYGLCGTVHAWNEPYWKALGMNARRRAFPGHTNSEIEYGGNWHAFDTDMAGLVFRRDGIVAGYDDIIRDPTLIDVDRAPLPRYPFAWPSDFNVMKQGWQEVARGGNWYKMYHSGYAAQPGIVHLRSGETFTRYYNPDHFGGPSKRRFWHVAPGGPARDWTFINRGTPEHNGARSNSRSHVTYCNGEFVYRPHLERAAYAEGVAEQSANVVCGSESPRLRSRDGGEAHVTFQHFSPYVICGDPADDANPMTGPATGGLIVAGTAIEKVQIDLSGDQGQTWNALGEVRGHFEKDITDGAKGRYGWWIRFRWTGNGGLDDLAFTTVTQVAQTIYPRLKPDRCSVTYRAASRAVVPMLPNFGAEESVVSEIEDRSHRSSNVSYSPRTLKSRVAYQLRSNQPGTVAWRVTVPSPLLQVSAAARFTVRVPSPSDCDFHLDVSADGGNTWSPLGRAEIPRDNEYSSGWVYGMVDVSAKQSKQALIRAHLFAGGTQTGLIAAEAYGIHRTAPPQKARLTFGWQEAGTHKTHVEEIPDGTQEKKLHILTGKEITDDFVRIEVP